MWERREIKIICDRYEMSGRGADNAADFYQLGEGDSAYVDTEIRASFGHFNLEKAIQQGGDDRKDYLQRKPSDILYWWHILDTNSLITMMCVKLKQELQADCFSTPPTTSDEAQAGKRKAELARGTESINKNLDKWMGDISQKFGATMTEFGTQMFEENSRQNARQEALIKEENARQDARIQAENARQDDRMRYENDRLEIMTLKKEIRELRITMIREEKLEIKAAYGASIEAMEEEVETITRKRQRVD